MASIRRVFFGCNYNDKRIKSQFDLLKGRLEERHPIDCVVIDKRAGKSARDLWKDIRAEIQLAGVLFFDVTAFRPNVVLELGYGLALKEESQLYITFRNRKSSGRLPQWLLSDITHLNRFEYTTVAQLDEFVEEQLNQSAWLKRMSHYYAACHEETNAPEKYKEQGLKVLHALRDDGHKTADQIKTIVQGSAVRREALTRLLTDAKLVKRTPGQPGRFYLRED
jgi:hypothetical protein